MSTPALVEVPIAPLPLERFREVLDDDGYQALMALQRHAADLLAGRVVWCVNSTAQGGGVAEMLRSLLAYTRGAGVDTRWSVLQGTPSFFAITKRLHNRLHGEPGDGGPLGDAERAEYEAVTAAGARELARLLRPGDVVILHDPQTAGMAPALRGTGAHVVWRLHVGADEGNGLLREAVEFLMPYVEAADAWVFSRRRFIWDSLDVSRAVVVAPSIDVFSPKNQTLGPDAAEAILRVTGILEPGPTGAARFVREDGTPGRVDRSAMLVQDRPLRDGERYVAQVSRWDRLKDPLGVLAGFAGSAQLWAGAHLVLAGPAAEGVSDDPEAAEVLAEVTDARRALPAALRERVHLLSLPMADAEENAAMFNAIQSRAAVVVQKSLAEGFGLTVTEAMWKARPLVVSRVGGIQDQLTDGVDGLLVDPHDLSGFGAAVGRLLNDPELTARLGAAARDRARADFLEPRHLGQWVEIIEALSGSGVANR
jgi:trehalose synthase